jgi:histone-lysine N-methyltransferase SETMAR
VFGGIQKEWFIPNGRSITAALYCQQLDRVQESLRLNYPALVNRNQVVFLQNNAKPHTPLLTRAKLDELGWEVLSHPPYSPDLAPSDYHLFRSMEHFLRGREFEDIDQVEAACQEFFNSKEPIIYRRGIVQVSCGPLRLDPYMSILNIVFFSC